MIKHRSTGSTKIHKAASQWRVRVFEGDSEQPKTDCVVWVVNPWVAVRHVTKLTRVVYDHGHFEGNSLHYIVHKSRRLKTKTRVVVDFISEELSPVVIPAVG